mgnify:CR=1 FL=1|jgi:hypothetical protein
MISEAFYGNGYVTSIDGQKKIKNGKSYVNIPHVFPPNGSGIMKTAGFGRNWGTSQRFKASGGICRGSAGGVRRKIESYNTEHVLMRRECPWADTDA